jgi:putative transposase
VRDIIRQVCAEMGVTIVNGALSQDHVHMFVEIPPHITVGDCVRMAKGRSSRKYNRSSSTSESAIGLSVSGPVVTSPTSRNITDDVVMNYLDKHTISKGFSATA